MKLDRLSNGIIISCLFLLVMFCYHFDTSGIRLLYLYKEPEITKKGRTMNTQWSNYRIADEKKSGLGKEKQENVTNKLYQNSDREIILSTAKEITRGDNILLLSFINNAYLPFAYSWLCNTKYMNISHQLLIIAADDETAIELHKNRPDIKVLAIHGYHMKGNQTYTRAGYVRVGIKRTQIINWILQDNIGVFLIEFDCLWLRNPVPDMTQYKDYDLVITPVSNRPNMVAIGFYYMLPTDRMKTLWQELTKRLTELDKQLEKMNDNTVISEGLNDQVYLTQLIQQKYGNIRLKLLNVEQYPDGKWYQLPESKRSLEHVYIINNNWIRGNKAKIERAKQFGHWFLKNDETCDDNRIRNLVNALNKM